MAETWIKGVSGVIAVMCMVLFVARCLVVESEKLWSELASIPANSAYNAGAMALMIGYPQWKLVGGPFAKVVWYSGLVLYLQLKFNWVFHRFNRWGDPEDITSYMPPAFVSTVGIGAAAVSFKPELKVGGLDPGTITLYMSLVQNIVLLPLIAYAMYVREDGPPKTNSGSISAGVCVFTAPTYLCFVGWMNVKETSELRSGFLNIFTYTQFIVGVVCFLVVLLYYPSIILHESGFNPSWSALTFPFIITAVGFINFWHTFVYTPGGNCVGCFFFRVVCGLMALLALLHTLVTILCYVRLILTSSPPALLSSIQNKYVE